MQTEYRKLSKEDVPEMQRIVGLLVDFDERTGRHQRYEETHTHWFRKAAAKARTGDVEFFARPLAPETFVYSVVAVIVGDSASGSTKWIHEDGIRMERDSNDIGHPVHKIVCLTDLYDRAQDGGEYAKILSDADMAEAVK